MAKRKPLRFVANGVTYRVPREWRPDELELFRAHTGLTAEGLTGAFMSEPMNEELVAVAVWLTIRRRNPGVQLEDVAGLELRLIERPGV